MVRKRSVSAWLYYWKHQSGSPLPIASDGEVVAVLPSRSADKRVKETLERLYLERAATPAELILWRKEGSGPYPARHDAYIHQVPYAVSYSCGHNPILRARYVENLVSGGEYELSWDEIGPKHHLESCRSLYRVSNCPEAGREALVVRKRWVELPVDGQEN